MSWKNARKKNSQSLKFLSYEPHSEKFQKNVRNSTSIFDEVIGTVQRQDSSSISEIITLLQDEHILDVLSDHLPPTSSISLPTPLGIARLMDRYDIWSTQENSDDESIQSEEQNTDIETNVIHK
ncbi:7727_t:CDS:2 [Ambispora leptoticha]|uniref:7727_t:CDS:1 n=1 Tax=Ambispora leptoticha TaxID=144679 RepID=A0A9N8VZ83_9GLOM|nr:7727_t:CDS:2 [Ambispora leptoticha]